MTPPTGLGAILRWLVLLGCAVLLLLILVGVGVPLTPVAVLVLIGVVALGTLV